MFILELIVLLASVALRLAFFPVFFLAVLVLAAMDDRTLKTRAEYLRDQLGRYLSP